MKDLMLAPQNCSHVWVRYERLMVRLMIWEVYWAEHSKHNWLHDGDKNTAFFHKKAKQRRKETP